MPKGLAVLIGPKPMGDDMEEKGSMNGEMREGISAVAGEMAAAMPAGTDMPKFKSALESFARMMMANREE